MSRTPRYGAPRTPLLPQCDSTARAAWCSLCCNQHKSIDSGSDGVYAPANNTGTILVAATVTTPHTAAPHCLLPSHPICAKRFHRHCCSEPPVPLGRRYRGTIPLLHQTPGRFDQFLLSSFKGGGKGLAASCSDRSVSSFDAVLGWRRITLHASER